MTSPYRFTEAEGDEAMRLLVLALWRIKAHLYGDTPLPDGRSDGDPS